ncbi:hypothetical protein EWH23_03135 [Meiothermus sp. PNK-Is4]|uniref:DNA primase family protein n=1 Tax=Meiothermus sp. PNK-Is4 TaxID=2740565 RepID=UPI0010228819|nr:phage/plasmid primase, P4 family [Meiothermus sp. PNK-Is4]RYM39496.1 hypothetical protein EWH23_03135 [Meiothermus sp. PNK-Is4]
MTKDALTHSIERVDLPALVCELWPESGARPGRAGVCRAVWRGDTHPSLSLFQARGMWFWKDHASGESGNAFHLLLRAGMSKEEAAELLKARAGEEAALPSRRPPAGHPRRGSGAASPDDPLSGQSPDGPVHRADDPLSGQTADAAVHQRAPGLTPEERRALEEAQRRLDEAAIEGRGITLEQARRVGLGKSRQGDLVIPILGPSGEPQAVKTRLLAPEAGYRYRYLTPGRGAPPWYSPGFGQHPERAVLVMEGELNAITSWFALEEKLDVIGMPGVEGRVPWESLAGRRVYLYADEDERGRTALERWLQASFAAARRGSEHLAARAADVATLEPLGGGLDACEWAHAQGQESLKARLLTLVEGAYRCSPDGEAAHQAPHRQDEDWPPKRGAVSPFLDTEGANADRIVQHFGADLAHVEGQGWLVWAGTHWERSDAVALEIMQRLPQLVLQEALQAGEAGETEKSQKLFKWAQKSDRLSTVRNSVVMASWALRVREWELDARTNELPLENGVLNLESLTLGPHRKLAWHTHVLPHPYDPYAECPRWERFLEEVLPDENLRRYVQKAVGYSLLGDNREHVIFLCYGSGANGKSVFLEVLSWLFGPYAHRADPELLLQRNSDRHPTEIAAMRGKRLVVMQEVDPEGIWRSALLKSMSGDNTLTARKIRENPITFTVTWKVWIAANHLPRSRDHSEAFWRRIKLIPFNVTIPPERRDRTLPWKLREESVGLLAWAVQGLRMYYQEGLQEPEAIAQANRAYREREDQVGRFLKERCQLGGGRTASSALYAAYQEWALEEGERMLSQKAFVAELEQRGLERKRLAEGIFFLGMELPTERK